LRVSFNILVYRFHFSDSLGLGLKVNIVYWELSSIQSSFCFLCC